VHAGEEDGLILGYPAEQRFRESVNAAPQDNDVKIH
jgi:hypothetical protein